MDGRRTGPPQGTREQNPAYMPTHPPNPAGHSRFQVRPACRRLARSWISVRGFPALSRPATDPESLSRAPRLPASPPALSGLRHRFPRSPASALDPGIRPDRGRDLDRSNASQGSSPGGPLIFILPAGSDNSTRRGPRPSPVDLPVRPIDPLCANVVTQVTPFEWFPVSTPSGAAPPPRPRALPRGANEEGIPCPLRRGAPPPGSP